MSTRFPPIQLPNGAIMYAGYRDDMPNPTPTQQQIMADANARPNTYLIWGYNYGLQEYQLSNAGAVNPMSVNTAPVYVPPPPPPQSSAPILQPMPQSPQAAAAGIPPPLTMPSPSPSSSQLPSYDTSGMGVPGGIAPGYPSTSDTGAAPAQSAAPGFFQGDSKLLWIGAGLVALILLKK